MVHYAKGSYSSTHNIDRGAGFYGDPTSPHTVMMLSYDVYFDHNFDFVKGGKLPGENLTEHLGHRGPSSLRNFWDSQWHRGFG